MIRGPKKVKLVFDGQSRVAIPSWDGLLGYSWARLVVIGMNVTTWAQAISGTSITELLTTFDSRVARKIAGVEPCVYFMMGGESDILTEGDSANTVYTQLGAYIAKVRAAGANYVIASTVLPGSLFDEDVSGTAETRRQAYNALILSDPNGYFDMSVDVNIPELQDYEDREIYFDRVHPWGPSEYNFPDNPTVTVRGRGTQIIADLMRPYIEAAIAEVIGVGFTSNATPLTVNGTTVKGTM